MVTTRLLHSHQYLLLGILVLLLPFIPGSKSLLLQKKLISNMELPYLFGYKARGVSFPKQLQKSRPMNSALKFVSLA